MLLCEAQRIFGNRWTEIAKVVSGRTDNAVKNRFTTLCRKKAKNDAFGANKENKKPFINLNNKRISFSSEVNINKLRRNHLSDLRDICSNGEQSRLAFNTTNQLERSPFSVISQNLPNFGTSLASNVNIKHATKDASMGKTEGVFLKKDDPKILALMQQAELLSSLALKVNSENSYESLENAWKVVQDFINENEGRVLKNQFSQMNIQVDDFKGLAKESTRTNVSPRSSLSKPSVVSEDSTGKSESIPCNAACSKDAVETCEEASANGRAMCEYSAEQCDSPLLVTPLFRMLASAIPSPKFSESERQFLVKTFGMDRVSPNPSTNNPSHHRPSCKRVLLHSL
ncbi:unnamed protein product [Cuscuta campestris]|nr:unnamed protein product [Cuscuta campestris]